MGCAILCRALDIGSVFLHFPRDAAHDACEILLALVPDHSAMEAGAIVSALAVVEERAYGRRAVGTHEERRCSHE